MDEKEVTWHGSDLDQKVTVENVFPADDAFCKGERIRALLYLARKYYEIILALGIQDGHSKSYDPLNITFNEDGSIVAHTYVFDLEDGGRHHPLPSLVELERQLTDDVVKQIKQYINELRLDISPVTL